MERIAIISDIHGNLQALKTVLEDIKKRKIKRIFCLGDIIGKGSNSHECIELVKKHCEVILQGNNEDFFTLNKANAPIDAASQRRIEWNNTLLSKEDKDYLANLDFSYEFYMSGSLVRLFHASPTAIASFCNFFDSLSTKYSMFLPSPFTLSQKRADVVIYGHNHTAGLEKIYNRTLINVGSVGDATNVFRNDLKDADCMETTRVNYVILEGEYGSSTYEESFSYQFVNIPYDIDAELQNQKNNVEMESYIVELKEGKYRDMNRFYKSLEKYGIDSKDI